MANSSQSGKGPSQTTQRSDGRTVTTAPGTHDPGQAHARSVTTEGPRGPMPAPQPGQPPSVRLSPTAAGIQVTHNHGSFQTVQKAPPELAAALPKTVSAIQIDHTTNVSGSRAVLNLSHNNGTTSQTGARLQSDGTVSYTPLSGAEAATAFMAEPDSAEPDTAEPQQEQPDLQPIARFPRGQQPPQQQRPSSPPLDGVGTRRPRVTDPHSMVWRLRQYRSIHGRWPPAAVTNILGRIFGNSPVSHEDLRESDLPPLPPGYTQDTPRPPRPTNPQDTEADPVEDDISNWSRVPPRSQRQNPGNRLFQRPAQNPNEQAGPRVQPGVMPNLPAPLDPDRNNPLQQERNRNQQQQDQNRSPTEQQPKGDDTSATATRDDGTEVTLAASQHDPATAEAPKLHPTVHGNPKPHGDFGTSNSDAQRERASKPRKKD